MKIHIGEDKEIETKPKPTDASTPLDQKNFRLDQKNFMILKQKLF